MGLNSPIKDDKGWRIRYNTENYDLYKDIKVAAFIKFGRWQWAGHVIRMEEHRIPKKSPATNNSQQQKSRNTQETKGGQSERSRYMAHGLQKLNPKTERILEAMN
jgi:hypothetical protein